MAYFTSSVVLYDECEQILDSNFLTKDEAVKSGESLAFASFLVDIGDPVNNCNTMLIPNIKSEFDDKSEKTRTPKGDNLRNTFSNRKPQTAGRKASLINLSPSQKIIRDFKKNEVRKYGAHQSPTSPATSSFKEWEALYTTQITQKAKRYHDGFIRMITCGTQGRQVVLYDSSKSQIDKKFLKKDEVISSGESLMFDAYLVDIGDPIGTNEDDVDVKIQGRYNNTTEKSQIVAGGQRKKLFTAQPQDDACSSKCVSFSGNSSGFDGSKQKKQPASRTSLRDANQILSILRKPVAQNTISEVGDDPVEQCLSKSSELVQLENDNQPCHTADQGEVITAEKHTIEKAADEGHGLLCSEGSDSSSKATHADLTAPLVNANCTSDNVERSVPTQGIEILKPTAFESPHKSQSTDGSKFVDSNSSVSSKTTTHHQPKLPQRHPESKEKKSSTVDMSKPKCFGDLGGLKTTKNVKTEKPSITSDCPSFDLGI
ncbi:Protein ZGRF1 [Bienertia sinuspersici]